MEQESKSMEIRETVALLPCPFCGGNASLLEKADEFGNYSVMCNRARCMAEGSPCYSVEAAIAAWNTRTPDHAEAMKAAQDAIAVEKRALLAANAELAKYTEKMRVMREALEMLIDPLLHNPSCKCKHCKARATLASTAPVTLTEHIEQIAAQMENVPEKCPECDGEGGFDGTDGGMCHACNGTGNTLAPVAEAGKKEGE